MKKNLLNHLTAIHVMGWTKGIYSVQREDKEKKVAMYFNKSKKTVRPVVRWNPATNVEDALTLVERLKYKTRYFDVAFDPATGKWAAEFNEEPFGSENEVHADTFEEAVCLAALKYKGVQLRDDEHITSITVQRQRSKRKRRKG